MSSGWLTSLRGKEVVFTGENEGYEESELAALCLELGARRVSEDLNKSTNVLVRGFSPRWKHGTYGNKEKKAAKHQADGLDIVIIDLAGLLAIRDGRPAPTLTPNAPADPSPSLPPADVVAEAAVARVTAPYRAGQFTSAVEGSGEVFRDPEVVERGLQGHGRTADAFADFLELVGYEPSRGALAECQFDLAYWDCDGNFCVCEVKSLTPSNESWQIRHGLGQVLDYAHWLGQTLPLEAPQVVRPMLVLEREPRRAEYWRSLCTRHGVELSWAPGFGGVQF